MKTEARVSKTGTPRVKLKEVEIIHRSGRVTDKEPRSNPRERLAIWSMVSRSEKGTEIRVVEGEG